ncbi:MAG: hypothetical protein ABI784_08725 [Ginsengibacter sp.]
MKRFYLPVIFILFFFSAIGQSKPIDSISSQTIRVAVIAPLYLDSIFTKGQLKNSRSVSKLTMPYLDFVQGAEIALDTIDLKGKKVEAHFFDSRSFDKPLSFLIKNGQLQRMDLIIGAVKEPEYSMLADFGKQKKIPFVSAIFPNDGGIKDNPYTFIINSTLKAHCESIYSYLVQKHGTDNIYLVKKKNDNRIDNYFREINAASGKNPLLKIKTIVLDSSISSYGLSNLVDTLKPVVIIGASLDETFSIKLAQACYPLSKTNSITLIGMPNWDSFKGLFKKSAFPDFAIRYTTPHLDSKKNAFSDFLTSNYFKLYRTNPNDMAAKGFETMYYFLNILIAYNKDVLNHMNEDSLASFHEFNFRPVMNSSGSEIDYYENKHLYIMKIMNGDSSWDW